MCKAQLLHGECKNPECTYAHDRAELRTTTAFFKTKMCFNAASCTHGDACRYAHDERELRQPDVGTVTQIGHSRDESRRSGQRARGRRGGQRSRAQEARATQPPPPNGEPVSAVPQYLGPQVIYYPHPVFINGAADGYAMPPLMMAPNGSVLPMVMAPVSPTGAGAPSSASSPCLWTEASTTSPRTSEHEDSFQGGSFQDGSFVSASPRDELSDTCKTTLPTRNGFIDFGTTYFAGVYTVEHGRSRTFSM